MCSDLPGFGKPAGGRPLRKLCGAIGHLLLDGGDIGVGKVDIPEFPEIHRPVEILLAYEGIQHSPAEKPGNHAVKARAGNEHILVGTAQAAYSCRVGKHGNLAHAVQSVPAYPVFIQRESLQRLAQGTGYRALPGPAVDELYPLRRVPQAKPVRHAVPFPPISLRQRRALRPHSPSPIV